MGTRDGWVGGSEKFINTLEHGYKLWRGWKLATKYLT